MISQENYTENTISPVTVKIWNHALITLSSGWWRETKTFQSPVSINEEVFLCCIKTNPLVLTSSNSSDINRDKVKGKPQTRIVVGVHRKRSMFTLLRLLISWLRLTCVCTSNKVSNLFPVKKELRVQCQLSPSFIKDKLSWERGSPSQPSQLSQAFYTRKKLTPLPHSAHACSDHLKQYSHMLWLFHLDQVDSTGWTKVFIWRKVDSARRVTLPEQFRFLGNCLPAPP